MKNESEYRAKVDSLFRKIEQLFDSVDPDLAECEWSQGAVTILFSDRSRCILSAQPSVRQIWLALAARGTAYHFNFEESSQSWMDDKGRGIELTQFLETVFHDQTGLVLKIKSMSKEN
jgi:CyaY protein